ncbi:MAG: hypothetical protein M1830_007044, partial [Pleopsidium flavum]
MRPAPNEWLKSDEEYVQERLQREPRSPTPTPMSRPDDKRDLGPHPEPHTPTLNVSPTNLAASTRRAGFTPINVPSHTLVQVHHQEQQQKKRFSRSPSSTPMTAKRRKSTSPKIWQQSLAEAGAIVQAEEQRTTNLLYPTASAARIDNLTTAGPPSETRDLANKKFWFASTQDDGLVQKTASLNNVIDDFTPATRPLPLMRAGVDCESPSVHERVSITRNISQSSPSDARGMLQAVPPSATMSEFRYRRAPKNTDNKQPNVGEARMEPFTSEVAKVRKPRKMEFTSSGDPITRKPAQTSVGEMLQQGEGSVKRASTSQHAEDCSSFPIENLPGTSIASVKQALLQQQTDDTSRISSVLQEAQVLPNQSGNLPQAPSAPSTDLMETDKQSLHFGTEIDDPNAHLSTQAAIAKAQLSFRADIVSPIK